MTTYVPKKLDMPKEAYYRTLWTIKDYKRLQAEADACIARTPTQTETPEIQRQRDLTATERQNLRYADMMKTIRAIEDALTETVPGGYQKAVWDNIQDGAGWPLGASDSTYKRHKHNYIKAVAQKLHYI